jgi:hypothetical protein
MLRSGMIRNCLSCHPYGRMSNSTHPLFSLSDEIPQSQTPLGEAESWLKMSTQFVLPTGTVADPRSIINAWSRSQSAVALLPLNLETLKKRGSKG